MLAIRFNTALGLLLTGVLLMAAQFVLLTHPSLAHPLPRTVLISSDTQDTREAGCHEESAPTNQAPENHDCCRVGHLRAIGSAQVSIAPVFAATSVDDSSIQWASLDQTASPASQISDTGPPGSAVPIRV